jgi:nucleoside-diphosphate-sugar epimerase
MNVLVTGAYGRVGSAIVQHLGDREEYEFTYLDVRDHPDHETFLADIADYDEIRPAFDGQDAVVHLAGRADPSTPWGELLEYNVVGTYNVLEAAADAGVERFLFASSNHVMGAYQVEHAPELYDPGYDLTVDHRDRFRPKTVYGATKLFGEGLGSYYVEMEESPEQFYALRICGVRDEADNPPWGDAERGVAEGRWERGSEAYREQLAKRRAMGTSRRDFAHMVDCCLRDETVEFDVFYVTSDNDARWFDIEHAREVLGYDPQDNLGRWDRDDYERPPNLR